MKPFKRMKFSHIIIMLIYVFLIMPNGNFGLTTSITSSLHLPGFIVDAIFDNSLYTYMYYAGLVLAFYLNIRLFYTFIIFTSTNVSFVEALNESWKLTKKHFIAILKLVLSFAIISSVTMVGLLLIMQLPVLSAKTYFPGYIRITNSISQTIYLFLMVLTYAFFSVILIQLIVVIYHKLRNEKVVSVHEDSNREKKKWVNVIVFVVFVLGVAMVHFDDPSNPLVGDVLIVAHRGDSHRAIENTMESLVLANEIKPDYVEMDVQSTKDGTLVVFHDFDLKRMANRSVSINDLNWNELKNIELKWNSFVSRIPSFDEYMELARELDQKIIVEIKTTKKDSDSFLSDVMATVRKHNMEDMVLFQSLDKKAILDFKDMYPDATVGYILGLNIGKLENLNIDFYALEDFSMRERILTDLKRQGKGIFVWTVNTDTLMKAYLQMSVSGIITDYPKEAQGIQESLLSKRLSDKFWNLKFGF